MSTKRIKATQETMVIPLTEIRHKDTDRCVILNITESEESIWDEYARYIFQDVKQKSDRRLTTKVRLKE